MKVGVTVVVREAVGEGVLEGVAVGEGVSEQLGSDEEPGAAHAEAQPQRVQLAAPLLSLNVPAAHGVQAEAVEAPTALEAVPAAQGSEALPVQ